MNLLSDWIDYDQIVVRFTNELLCSRNRSDELCPVLAPSQRKFVHFGPDARNIARTNEAGDEGSAAFQKAKPEEVVIAKPDQRLAWESNQEPLDPATPLLRIAEEARLDRIGAILSSIEKAITEFCFPGRVTVVAIDVSVQPLEIFMQERGTQSTDRSIDDYPLVNFHIQAIADFFEDFLEMGFPTPDQKDRGERKNLQNENGVRGNGSL